MNKSKLYPLASVVDTIREPLLHREEPASTVVSSLQTQYGSDEPDMAIGYPVHEENDEEIIVAIPENYFPPARYFVPLQKQTKNVLKQVYAYG